MSSYGSESMGEVSMGTASTAFTGQRNQPMDAARQPLLVNASALFSALPGRSAVPGLSALLGQSFHSAAVHGDTPMQVEMGPALAGSPAIRQAPPLHFGGIRPLPNRTTATITSVTAPAVTMASYGGMSTSTSLGRPISSLGIAQNNQVLAPLGQTQQQWSGAIHQRVQLPYTQGNS